MLARNFCFKPPAPRSSSVMRKLYSSGTLPAAASSPVPGFSAVGRSLPSNGFPMLSTSPCGVRSMTTSRNPFPSCPIPDVGLPMSPPDPLSGRPVGTSSRGRRFAARIALIASMLSAPPVRRSSTPWYCACAWAFILALISMISCICSGENAGLHRDAGSKPFSAAS